MNRLVQYIRQSLSMRLSLGILAFVSAIFVVTIGFLFVSSRNSVRQAAEDETAQMLTNASLRMEGILNEVEVATENFSWQVLENLTPDSIYALSRNILRLNPLLNGCSIAFEPYFFPDQGKYFSAYSSNDEQHIESEQEGNDDYVYFDMVWYTEPKRTKKACWVDPFYDYNPSGIYARDIIASYCKPLITADGRYIGVISSDLTQITLSRMLSQEKAYPHSYFMLIGKNGRVIAAGDESAQLSDLQRSDCLVLQHPLGNTGWTMAVICPNSDIFKETNQLIFNIMSIIFFCLLLMLLFCYFVGRRTIAPIQLLAQKTHDISEGNFDGQLEKSSRLDEVGQLQNSFVDMQQYIANYVADLKRVKDEAERKGEELRKAKIMAEEADRQKMSFIQDIYHQIRTPLNIIVGFAQVLRDGHQFMSEEELNVVMSSMNQNTHTINNIVDNWMATLTLEGVESVECNDSIVCDELCDEAVGKLLLRNPDSVTLQVEYGVPESLCIKTNKEALLKVLQELLHNANKFTKQGSITLSCSLADGHSVRFCVSDTGPGIAEGDRQRVFEQFMKLDNFNEGLGMGLPLCKQLIRLLGGELELDTTYTDGSRFVVTLPL